jgi:hypothetical protein
VTQALSGPFLIAALTLCVAGAAKLRAPGPAVDALRSMSRWGSPALIRVAGAGELGLGIAAAISPGTVTGVVLALVYAAFAGLALGLHRRGAACGCFGDASRTPASPAHSLISAALAATAAAAAFSDVHGLAWVAERPMFVATALMVGIAGATYGIAAAYTELPAAWEAWGGR